MEDTDALLETLKRVAAALRDAGVPFAVAGSAAAHARGAGPPRKDVDFVLLERDCGAALDAVEAVGLTRHDPPEDWLTKAYDGDLLVDLIHRPVDRPVTAEVLDRAEPLALGGIIVPVLAATDLMVYRLLALSEHACDFGDVLPFARAVREQVDWSTVRTETADSPFAYAFLVLLERLSILQDGDHGGRTMTDERQHVLSRLQQRLAEDPRTNELGIEATFAGDVVRLSGQVTTEQRRRSVGEVATEAVDGRRVDNRVTVVEVAAPREGGP